MKDNKKSDVKDENWDEKSKKYPKPWTQETHDRFLKETGKTEKEHDAWHRQHDKEE